ncbi:MAG TPA: carboxylating nicotinate-nucleotide diphosphorylase [Methylophilaceae bacterium]|nr:carboxylating nicotinate-nucleotide diphosphorylase [Methylophilaceae bacterium]
MTIPLFTQQFPKDSAAFQQFVSTSVRHCLQEDMGNGDLTAELIDAAKMAEATIIARESAVICGIDWVNACFKQLDTHAQLVWHVAEGETLLPNQTLCEIKGNARAMLSAERTALNFLQTLSATATVTRQYVKAIEGLSTLILDTRKTIPGLRLAQKYAVTVGGGYNQRLALYDGILIKENHIMTAGSIHAALDAAFKLNKTTSIQIEVENINQLKEALAAGAKSILLDNFNLDQLREAVSENQGRAILEASGNVNLLTIRAIAETGVNRISIGSLTKHIHAIDLSMRVKMN